MFEIHSKHLATSTNYATFILNCITVTTHFIPNFVKEQLVI